MALCSHSPGRRPTVVVFRRAAAALWEFDGVAPGVIELATTAGGAGRGDLHRLLTLDPQDCQRFEGLLVTSVARTLVDLGQVASADVVERAVEWALRRGHVSVGRLADMVAAVPNRPGTRALRELLARRSPGSPATESDAETLFLQLARRAGLPEPQRQYAVPTAEGNFRLDFAWPSRGLGVEIDGAGAHASRDALRRDLRRQNRLVLSLASAGWALLRFTWDDVASPRYGEQVAANLREAWLLGLNRAGRA